MLHPELGQLQEKYDELVSSVENGHITYQDAVNILNSMVALDASGFEWRIDVDGNFTKAFPGQQPIVVDPKTYYPSGAVTGSTAAPGGWGAGSPNNFENTDLSTPPFAINPQGYDNSDFTGRSPNPLPVEGEVKSSKVKIPNIDFGKKKTLIIVAVSVLIGVVLLVSTLSGRGSSDELTTLDQEVPSEVSSEETTNEIIINEEVPAGEDSADEVAEVSVELISLKQARSLVKTLQEGKIAKLNKNIPGNLGNKLEVTGFLDAAKRYKAKVTVKEVQGDASGASNIVIEIAPRNNGEISIWTLPVTKNGETWVVQGSPTRVS